MDLSLSTGSMEGAQFCIGKLLQLLRNVNVLLRQLICSVYVQTSLRRPLPCRRQEVWRSPVPHYSPPCMQSCMGGALGMVPMLLLVHRHHLLQHPVYYPLLRRPIDSKSAYTSNGAVTCFWILVKRQRGSSGNLVLCAWQQSRA